MRRQSFPPGPINSGGDIQISRPFPISAHHRQNTGGSAYLTSPEPVILYTELRLVVLKYDTDRAIRHRLFKGIRKRRIQHPINYVTIEVPGGNDYVVYVVRRDPRNACATTIGRRGRAGKQNLPGYE